MTLADQKWRLRAELRQRRAAAVERAGPGAAARLADRFSEHLPRITKGITAPDAVSGYWPMADEMDVRLVLSRLAAAGWRCALPVTPSRGHPLTFRAWCAGDQLAPGRFGTSEPLPDAAVVIPALVLVPLLGYDRRGNRIGYGAGYYDRTLAALRGAGFILAVGVGYAAQEVEAMPVGGNDQRLDWIVTEEAVIDCRFADEEEAR